MVYPLLDGTTKAMASQNPSDQLPHDHRMMHASAPLDAQRTQLESPGDEATDRHNGGNGHRHHKTASMVKVEREHLWFALVGVAVVFFKVILDSTIWRRSFMLFAWPTSVAVLGMLLVFYTE